MCILLQHISNPSDFVKYISRKMSLYRKEVITQQFLSRGKIKKVLSFAHGKQRARNAHDQNKQIFHYKQLNTFDHPYHIHKYLDTEHSTFLLDNRYIIFNKGPVKLMQWVKIAHSFLQCVSNQFHIIILSMPM